jgi:hypothetical protein
VTREDRRTVASARYVQPYEYFPNVRYALDLSF